MSKELPCKLQKHQGLPSEAFISVEEMRALQQRFGKETLPLVALQELFQDMETKIPEMEYRVVQPGAQLQSQFARQIYFELTHDAKAGCDALRFHPDKSGPGCDTTLLFQTGQDAYETLSDPARSACPDGPARRRRAPRRALIIT